jgi:hypothetical protein
MMPAWPPSCSAPVRLRRMTGESPLARRSPTGFFVLSLMSVLPGPRYNDTTAIRARRLDSRMVGRMKVLLGGTTSPADFVCRPSEPMWPPEAQQACVDNADWPGVDPRLESRVRQGRNHQRRAWTDAAPSESWCLQSLTHNPTLRPKDGHGNTFFPPARQG